MVLPGGRGVQEGHAPGAEGAEVARGEHREALDGPDSGHALDRGPHPWRERHPGHMPAGYLRRGVGRPGDVPQGAGRLHPALRHLHRHGLPRGKRRPGGGAAALRAEVRGGPLRARPHGLRQRGADSENPRRRARLRRHVAGLRQVPEGGQPVPGLRPDHEHDHLLRQHRRLAAGLHADHAGAAPHPRRGADHPGPRQGQGRTRDLARAQRAGQQGAGQGGQRHGQAGPESDAWRQQRERIQRGQGVPLRVDRRDAHLAAELHVGPDPGRAGRGLLLRPDVSAGLPEGEDPSGSAAAAGGGPARPLPGRRLQPAARGAEPRLVHGRLQPADAAVLPAPVH
mmetsp:Transcript_80985/g.208472  ORF Transcript_80985/g.208472 Transcript_80985/m.208472 type:complete len:340 (+) Transcript_80985:426-1445(+)